MHLQTTVLHIHAVHVLQQQITAKRGTFLQVLRDVITESPSALFRSNGPFKFKPHPFQIKFSAPA